MLTEWKRNIRAVNNWLSYENMHNKSEQTCLTTLLPQALSCGWIIHAALSICYDLNDEEINQLNPNSIFFSSPGVSSKKASEMPCYYPESNGDPSLQF